MIKVNITSDKMGQCQVSCKGARRAPCLCDIPATNVILHLIIRKCQKPKLGDSLQNNWPEVFKSVKVMEDNDGLRDGIKLMEAEKT